MLWNSRPNKPPRQPVTQEVRADEEVKNGKYTYSFSALLQDAPATKIEVPESTEEAKAEGIEFEFPTPIATVAGDESAIIEDWLKNLPEKTRKVFLEKGHLAFQYELAPRVEHDPNTGKRILSGALSWRFEGSSTSLKNAYIPKELLSLVTKALDHELRTYPGRDPEKLVVAIDFRLQTPEGWRNQGDMAPHIDMPDKNTDVYVWATQFPTETVTGSVTPEQSKFLTEKVGHVGEIQNHPELHEATQTASLLPNTLYVVPVRKWMHGVPRSIADPTFPIDQKKPRLFARIAIAYRGE